VDYYFFFLRNVMLALSAASVGMATWSASRAIRAGARRRLLRSIAAILLSSQFFGLTILLFFPELHLVACSRFSNDFVKGFSTQKFFRITPGMKRSEVEAILGRGRHGACVAPGYEESLWIYSGQFGATGWRFWITFDEKGIVERREAYWWSD